MKSPLTNEVDDGGSRFFGGKARSLLLGVLSLRRRMVEGWNLEESGVQGQGPGWRHSFGNCSGEIVLKPLDWRSLGTSVDAEGTKPWASPVWRLGR